MEKQSVWMFNEKKFAGINYTDQEIADDYDNQHGFRNFEEEAERIMEVLQLSSDSVVLDMGCGTGALTTYFAKKCKHVYAADVSSNMIDSLEKKITQQNIENITTVVAGFLEYQHSGEPLDAIVTTVALHHLPDFWKQVAMVHFHRMLKPGGKLFIGDVVFGFQPSHYGEEIDGWLSKMGEMAGEKMKNETVVHIRDEYSTWDWVMTGMLERAGFEVIFSGETMKNMMVFIGGK